MTDEPNVVLTRVRATLNNIRRAREALERRDWQQVDIALGDSEYRLSWLADWLDDRDERERIIDDVARELGIPPDKALDEFKRAVAERGRSQLSDGADCADPKGGIE